MRRGGLSLPRLTASSAPMPAARISSGPSAWKRRAGLPAEIGRPRGGRAGGGSQAVRVWRAVPQPGRCNAAGGHLAVGVEERDAARLSPQLAVLDQTAQAPVEQAGQLPPP